MVDAFPVTVSNEPSKVRFASSTIALVPLPVRRRLLVNVVAPVPPLDTASVPEMFASVVVATHVGIPFRYARTYPPVPAVVVASAEVPLP